MTIQEMKHVGQAFVSRAIKIAGKLHVGLPDSVLVQPLLRQSNTPRSKAAFLATIELLKQSRYTELHAPADLGAGFRFVISHFGSLKVVADNKIDLSSKPGLLLLKSPFFFLYRDFFLKNGDAYRIAYKNPEWMLIERASPKDGEREVLRQLVDNSNHSGDSREGFGGSQFDVRPNGIDHVIIQEVKNTYLPFLEPHLPKFDKPIRVLDLGGHIGGFSIQFGLLAKGKAVVHAYEPEPDNAKYFAQNLSRNGNLVGVTLFNEGVSDRDGVLPLYINGEHSAAHTVGIPLSYSTPTVNVPVVSLRKAFERLGSVDILKVDIEGSEYRALLPFKDLLQKQVKLIVGEAHAITGHTTRELMEFLKSCGFKLRIEGEEALLCFYGEKVAHN